MREQKSLTLILARAFASNLSMPISVHDRTGRIVFYNASAEAVFGVKLRRDGRAVRRRVDGALPARGRRRDAGSTRGAPGRRCAHRTEAGSQNGALHEARQGSVRSGGDRVPVDGTRGRAVRGREDLLGRGGGFVSRPRGPNAGRGSRSPSRSTRDDATRHGRQKGLVLILAREFASNLAMPIYVADADETLVYFNESAEKIGGRSFAETGEMPVRHWARMLVPRGADGSELSREEMPGGIAYSGAPTGARHAPDLGPRRRRAGDRHDRVPAVRPGRRVSRDHGHLLGAGLSDQPCERRFGRCELPDP